MESPAIAIAAKALNKVFNPASPAAVTALQNIHLEVAAGEFVSLVGPSGCGKSTLLRLIADLLPPSSGELRINTKSPQQARHEREYGMVFQAATLYQWRSISKNVQLPLELMGYNKTERQQRAQSMLEMVELGNFANHYPWQLSGGMQQRVSIARALAFDPAILLMDEPFGALDEFTRERMNLELLRIWRQTGKTILFVTHSIAEAVFLSQRIAVMSPRPGRITDILPIPLPYPRDFNTRNDPAFHALVAQVRGLLRDAIDAEFPA